MDIQEPPVNKKARRAALVSVDARGLYCAAGGFHIDPWRPVPRALITHAHADHLRAGSEHYLLARPGLGLSRARLPPDASIDTLDYGERRRIGAVTVSLHPAGHVLGSAQVRIEHRGEVWVVSGDYKMAADTTCAPFEPLRCDTFVSECTFGLPIYRWEPPAQTGARLNALWLEAVARGEPLLVGAYALGKAQRLLSLIAPEIGPVWLHGAVANITDIYRSSGVALPASRSVSEASRGADFAGALVLAPPSALHGAWARRFRQAQRVLASGWMTVRGARRRRGVDGGLVLSDHADWPGLLQAITATGAERVLLTHGHTAPLQAYLRSLGLDANALDTEYEGEAGGEHDGEPPPVAAVAAEIPMPRGPDTQPDTTATS